MRENIRRILIFITIVGTGTLFLFLDLPLLVILPLILFIGIVLLILLGALPVTELKTTVSNILSRDKKKSAAEPGVQKQEQKQPATLADPAKKRLPFGLDSLFTKKAAGQKPSIAAPARQVSGEPVKTKRRFSLDIKSLFKRKSFPPAQKNAAAQKQKPGTSAGKKSGLSLHASSLIGSLKALGAILTTRKKTDPDKIKKIDSMLDYAVSQKANEPSPGTGVPMAGEPVVVADAGFGQGGSGSVKTAEEDPFLSLSNDELESGLLDDLDEEEQTEPVSHNGGEEGGSAPVLPDSIEGIDLGAADMPVPPQDVTLAAEDILKENEPEMTDLPALEGIESVDENLGELDNLNLDSVDLEDEDEESEEGDVPAAAIPAAAATVPVAAAPAPVVPSGESKMKAEQSEMAAFAAASGSDDDMLSSLASDIKTVKKEQNLSLLRDLKDFRAPGATIESELTELYTSLNTATEKQKSVRTAGKTKAKPK